MAGILCSRKELDKLVSEQIATECRGVQFLICLESAADHPWHMSLVDLHLPVSSWHQHSLHDAVMQHCSSRGVPAVLSLDELYQVYADAEECWPHLRHVHDRTCIDPLVHLFSLIYTSGSSGVPKGVMINQANWLEDFAYSKNFDFPLVVLSYLPASWGADRTTVWGLFYNGGRVAFSPGGAQLWDDVKLARPTQLVCPPSIVQAVVHEFRSQCVAQASESVALALVAKRFRTIFGDRLELLAVGTQSGRAGAA
jgi:acyl-CoA synthetase (AMP-forming)/AMP-acid ligase II